MLNQITPLILTFNEAPNIGRTLEKLCWAKDVVVVDSFSEDETLEVISEFPNVRVVQRGFDCHENQWNFGLTQTNIHTPWVLALDADYVLTEELIEDLRALRPEENTNGYRASFFYCVNGRPLRSGVYPPVTVLYRRAAASYTQDGHTHRVIVEGQIKDLRSAILHDDRKSLSRWFQSQQRYTKLEAQKLLNAKPRELSWKDRIRRLRVIAPVAILFYCLAVRGGVFDGWPGFFYAFQRMLAELMLSLQLLETDLRGQRSEVRDQKEIAEKPLTEIRVQKLEAPAVTGGVSRLPLTTSRLPLSK
jgi:glycosyltransferase involved in cell wall biosynthesis